MGNVQNSLMICHVNCQCLLPHIDAFKLFSLVNKYDIICMSETWLKDSMKNGMIALSGYYLLRCDRVGKNGGGVGVFIREDIRANIIESSCCPYKHEPKCLSVYVALPPVTKLLLAVAYRPSKAGNIARFAERSLKLFTAYKHSVIMGDLNSDLMGKTIDSEHLENL